MPGLAFAIEYGADFVHEPAYPVAFEHRRNDTRTVTAAELLERAAAKLLVRHPGRDSADLLSQVRPLVGRLAEVTHSTPVGPGLLEVSAAGVSKATALARLCAGHGIDAADVVAFGDMPNDLPMLEWAGRPYAMANAHPDVLAAVPTRAPSNDEDGVAVVLERLLRRGSTRSRIRYPAGNGPGRGQSPGRRRGGRSSCPADPRGNRARGRCCSNGGGAGDCPSSSWPRTPGCRRDT